VIVLKLLVIAPSYNYFIKSIVEAQSKYVDKIDVLVHHNNLAEISNYIFFVRYFDHIRRYTKKNLIDEKDRPENVKVHLISTLYFIPDGSNKRLGDRLAKKFDEYIMRNRLEFDLIHAHFTWPAGYVGSKLKEKHDVPLIVTAHGFDIYDLPFRDNEWRKKIRYVLNAADYVVTVSDRNLKCIKKLNIKTPVKVLPNGFRRDLFYPKDYNESKKTLNLPLDKKIILTVGNLAEVKGHRYLIEAMQEVVKRRKDVMCIIVGGGKLETQLKNQIEKLDLNDNVELVGPKPHDEISIWMNACDIFVLPSLNEGNPTVMFECLGCVTPFIATKVGGIPEIITSEDYGILCEPGNAKELSQKILIAFEKEWKREKIRKYAERFTWDKITNEIIKIYEEML